jgi:2-dehydro-3-deoxyphosphogluconate aldolase / (4S)-4-hydroxy-2-oxoglutarate aldolase
MSAPPKAPVFDQLSTVGIIPVVAVSTAAQALDLAAALAEGGLPAAEITFRTSVAAEAIAAIAASQVEILLGAGTVITPEQVDQAAAAGATYIVSPGTSRSVVLRARSHGLPVLPGAVTATEIHNALELGLNTVKFFPAGTSGGPAAIRALAAPFGDVSFVPTGDVGMDNLEEYLRIPAVRAVGGSWMVPQDMIDASRFRDIAKLASEAASAVSRIRSA